MIKPAHTIARFVVVLSTVALALTSCAWVRSYWWHTSIERVGGKCTIPTIIMPGMMLPAERRVGLEIGDGALRFEWAGDDERVFDELRGFPVGYRNTSQCHWVFADKPVIPPNDAFEGGFVFREPVDVTQYRFAGFAYIELTRKRTHSQSWTIPLWFVSIVLATPGALAVLRCVRRHRRSLAGLCAHCGYDMIGSSTGVCPECGQASAKV